MNGPSDRTQIETETKLDNSTLQHTRAASPNRVVCIGHLRSLACVEKLNCFEWFAPSSSWFIPATHHLVIPWPWQTVLVGEITALALRTILLATAPGQKVVV